MKKNINILSKTVLAAVLTASITVPVIATPAEAAVSVIDVIYETDGQHASISFNTFTSALNAEVLTDFNIKYIKISDKKYYNFNTFTSAFNASDSLSEALDLLSSTDKGVTEIPNLAAGKVDVNTGSVVAAPVQAAEFKVLSIE